MRSPDDNRPPTPFANLPPVAELDLEALGRLGHDIGDLFQRHDTRFDWPAPGHFRFRGVFLCDPADCFDELRRRFERHGFTPLLREEDGQTVVVGLPVVFDPPASGYGWSIVLFIATILSTLFAAAAFEPGFTGYQIWLGWPFSLSIMTILTAHELGHYFAARYHKVPVSPPYFIPLPISFIGTMGAFIRLKAPMQSRRVLLDVGAAGPLAGLVFAVPILLYGLATSDVLPFQPGEGLLEGNSLLYAAAKWVVHGQLLPSATHDVFLNQWAWAGWVGLLVTGLNLIPLGQLDGGHLAYVLFGRQASQLYWPVLIALSILAVYGLFNSGVLVWGLFIILLYFFGRVHAQPLDDVTPLDPRRRFIAIFTLFLFLLVFVPIPFALVTH